MARLTKEDIWGVSTMIPTPCKEGQGHWSFTDTVDLEESARMTENLIEAGVGVLSACGTTGEGHSLLWDEKVGFIDTLVQVGRHRTPIFAGATSLGTRETIRQMKALSDLGAEGAFVGLPLWQTPTIENSVDFFADLGEAVPNMAIMVYANPMFFKSSFPTAFWAGIGRKAPSVVTNKVGAAPFLESLAGNVKASPQVAHLVISMAVVNARKLLGDEIRGFWSTAAPMGPEPEVALWEAVSKDDQASIDEIMADRAAMARPPAPSNPDIPSMFAYYNVQTERVRMNAAGYVKAGPVRPPYHHPLPDEQRIVAETTGREWAKMRQKYIKATA